MADSVTLAQQALASDPSHSAWVSANAGSGKTTVLAGRVVRLLLSGVDPSCILCLTFTKAAAGEMANRVFRDLAAWTQQDDTALRESLASLTGQSVSDAQLAVARTLFAKALETPGGLKIQTIHAFCEAVLHRFPLEANIPGHFEQADEDVQRSLLELARRQIVLKAQAGSDETLTDAFAVLLDHAGDGALDKLFGDILSKREALSAWLASHGGAAGAAAHLFAFFDVEPHFDGNEELSSALSMWLGEDYWWRAFEEALRQDGATMNVGLADEIAATRSNTLTIEERLDHFRLIVLNKSGSPNRRSGRPSKAVLKLMPEAKERMQALASQLSAIMQKIALHRQISLTGSALVMAEAITKRFRLLKRQRGLLDFDDLIMRTRDLLRRSEARSWVLYKLDMGIDHILVDEAQDTNPAQWQIISELVEEFFAGKSAREKRRTVFAVGDEKQSIYSFQGARPRSFSLQRRTFERRATRAGYGFKPARLNLSFRSTPVVLEAVDKIFKMGDHGEGLTFEASAYEDHVANRRNDPGFVEVWDRLEPRDVESDIHWHERESETAPHPAIRLADRVARRIAEMTSGRDPYLPKVAAGDIIVLVRRRDIFMPALTRALKARNVAVAGADRLSLVDHIAVQDLMALGRVALTLADDLSLAALLKSPLIGLDEDALFDLAHGRKGTLYEALKERGEEPAFASAYRRIQCWQQRSGQMPVHEFYDRVLGDDRGRNAFIARLGSECEDVLDAFLDLTLAHEQGGHAGLLGFLEGLAVEAPEIKREFDGVQDEVRIMTIHAAKGLEAKFVFVIDRSGQHLPSGKYPALYTIGNDEEKPDAFLWSTSSKTDSAPVVAALEQLKREALEEERRLLYVALTRACDGLYVCAYRGGNAPPKSNWYDMVTSGLADVLEDAGSLEEGIGIHRWQDGEFAPSANSPSPEEGEAKDRADMPPWLHHRLRPEPGLPRPLAPSSAGLLIDESLNRARAIPSLLEEASLAEGAEGAVNAAQLGTALHALLRHLPDMADEDRAERARAYLALRLPSLSAEEVERWIGRLQAVLVSPMLEGIFDETVSRAEVPLAGRMVIGGRERLVSGQIDRLVVTPGKVRIVDFKTSGTKPPDPGNISADHLSQMALYRALVQEIYPDREVEAVLVHVSAQDGAAVMPLPGALLEKAMAELTADEAPAIEG